MQPELVDKFLVPFHIRNPDFLWLYRQVQIKVAVRVVKLFSHQFGSFWLLQGVKLLILTGKWFGGMILLVDWLLNENVVLLGFKCCLVFHSEDIIDFYFHI
jgi:hypothetical protein